MTRQWAERVHVLDDPDLRARGGGLAARGRSRRRRWGAGGGGGDGSAGARASAGRRVRPGRGRAGSALAGASSGPGRSCAVRTWPTAGPPRPAHRRRARAWIGAGVWPRAAGSPSRPRARAAPRGPRIAREARDRGQGRGRRRLRRGGGAYGDGRRVGGRGGERDRVGGGGHAAGIGGASSASSGSVPVEGEPTTGVSARGQRRERHDDREPGRSTQLQCRAARGAGAARAADGGRPPARGRCPRPRGPRASATRHNGQKTRSRTPGRG